MTPALSPGAYLRLRRIAAGRSIEDVAAEIGTEPRYAEHDRAAWLRAIEDGAPATFATIVALRRAFRFDLNVLAWLAAVQEGFATTEPPVPICATCGCSECDPCLDVDDYPCGWATPDRCTFCQPPAHPAQAAA